VTPATVFLLAAGLGTRLRPLTDHVPKALVPVGNEPQLFRLAARFPESRLVVNAHHLADHLEDAVRAWEHETGRTMHVSREADVLGTAGGIRAARAAFADGPVLVHNADIEVPAAFDAVDPAAQSTLLVSSLRPAGAGNVGLDAGGRVVRLRAARAKGEETASCNYLGVALLAPELIEALPEVGCLVGDGWIPALQRGALLRITTAPDIDAQFFDLGTPASYLAANLAWLRERGLRIRAEAGAHVHAECSEVVVGRGAVLAAPAQRVVAWAGSRLDRRVQDAIVTTHGVIETQSAR
jgi:mannose-1-phosphate guanylyltransferase